MTTFRESDRVIQAFLREGEEQLRDQVYDAVRAGIEQTRQRAVIGPWRIPAMNKIVGFGLAAVAVVVALVVGTQLLGSRGNVGGVADATPTPEPTATPEPSVAEPTSTPEAFLPEGPLVVWDPSSRTPPVDGAPSITVTIPASGWSFLPEFPALSKGEDADPPEAAMLIGSDPPGTGFYVYGDPCHWASTKPENPATTVDELVAALAAQPSRDASEPVDVTVGGYDGTSIILHVPEDAPTRVDAFAECDGGEFASYEIEGSGSGPSRYHQGPGQIDEFWILDVEGSIVIIDAMYRPDTPAELIEEMRAIAESATFELP